MDEIFEEMDNIEAEYFPKTHYGKPDNELTEQQIDERNFYTATDEEPARKRLDKLEEKSAKLIEAKEALEKEHEKSLDREQEKE